jgi:uracil-DNA glycosylase
MMTTAHMEASWLERLAPEFEKPYMRGLEKFLSQEIKEGRTIYPPFELTFNALCQTAFDAVKVVIIGQDPYHGPGQAHGLSFSVPHGIPAPPSLQNIFKELAADVGAAIPNHGCLLGWAKQGVLLLNATLTVRENEPKSHYGRGWEEFTDRIVQQITTRSDPLVFVLWGRSALEKWKQVSTDGKKSHHLVLTAAHPSPFSAYSGFFGCRHFSKINDFLIRSNKQPIDWNALCCALPKNVQSRGNRFILEEDEKGH